MSPRRLSLLALPCLLIAADCKHEAPLTTTTPPQVTRAAGGPPMAAEDLPDGLQLTLSEGTPGSADPDRPPLAAATPLDAAATAKVLARLPDLPAAAQVDFSLRPASTPPPRTGATVDVPFPPPITEPPPDVPTGPVTVLRWQPDGDVPQAPGVSVTFDRPMVALTTQDEAARHVPVTLDPQPDGQWRWVGTRTLLFEPALRMPMATDYTLTVPAGTEAADGSTVATAHTSTFATPPPRLVDHLPTGHTTTSHTPVIVLTFDQAVDAAAVRERMTVTAGKVRAALRAPTAAEIAEDPDARRLMTADHPERRVAAVPVDALPAGATVSVTVPTGTPSAEGPRTTTGDQAFTFPTYGPLTLGAVTCGWDRKVCRPGAGWRLEFSNVLGTDQDLDARVTVEPAVPGMVIYPQGTTLQLQGATAPQTTYTITVTGLQDAFGQQLAAPETVTIKVGAREPVEDAVYLVGGGVQIPDPFAPPAVTFNVGGSPKRHVRVHRVTPADWEAFHAEVRWNQPLPPLPGTPLLDEVRTLGGGDGWQPWTLDLSPYATDGAAELVVEVAPLSGGKRHEVQRVWVEVTQLGLSVVNDAQGAWVIATDLMTGKGVPEVRIRQGDRTLGTTDAHGLLATDALPDARAPLVATQGDATTMLTPYGATGTWGRWTVGAGEVQQAWYVFDDRHLYRPGEVVHVKGWVRQVDLRRGGDLIAPSGKRGTVSWVLQDASGNEIGNGKTMIDGLGGLSLDLRLPDTPALGSAQLVLTRGTEQHWHTFEIQEFRRPEFEVGAQVEDAGPHAVGGHAVAAVHAAYYAGDPLPGATVRWVVQGTSTSWSPPGWDDDWRFGTWTPWWWDMGPMLRGGFGPRGGGAAPQTWTFDGRTDSSGTHRVRLDFVSVSPAAPTSLQIEGTVTDVNRQAWTGATTLLVHPAQVYVGVRPAQSWVELGDPVQVDVVVADLDGRAVAGRPVELALVHTRSVWKRGAWVEEEDDRQTCTLTSTEGVQTCALTPTLGGQLQLIATTTDADGHPNRTTTPVWVSGASSLVGSTGVEQERVTLVPDARSYAAGDVAELLVQAPFAPAEGLVTWRRSGVVHSEPIALPEGSATVRVPIDDAMVPGLTVQVDVYGTTPRTTPGGATGGPRPAYATGTLALDVPPRSRTLAVSVRPSVAAAAPGEPTEVTVEVRGADGTPVPDAQVALVAVDEAVLALTGYRIPDPLDVFYPARDPGAADHHAQPWIVLRDQPDASGDADDAAEELAALGYVAADAADFNMAPGAPVARGAMPKAAMRSMAMAESAPPPPPDAPIAVRSDFRADALWMPAVTTDAKGRATVPLDLPDSLTRYRITAVAVDGDRSFGTGTADLTVRLPLMLRPSAPRFLNFGDRAELPLVLQNQTDGALDVQLAIRASNATVDGGDRAGRRVRVPAHDRVEVRVPTATVSAGRAAYQAAAVSGRLADAATFDLPVYTPATTEAFATYGVLDGPAGTAATTQPLHLPGDVVPAFGGLTISTSTTQLAALTDAFVYLLDYPYLCAEQRASRVLAITALRDVLDAFDAPGLPDAQTLATAVQADLEQIRQQQNGDGTWGFWFRGERPSPMATLQVVHALVRAKAAGYDVDARTLDRGLDALDHLERTFDRWWSEEAKVTALSQAVAIRALAGRPVGADAQALFRRGKGPDGLSFEAMGWLLPTLKEADRADHDAIVAFLRNRVTETASTAQWVSHYSEADGAMLLHGGRRTDAVLLDAFLQTDPDLDLLPKVVEGLLGARVRGRWSSTQDNAWVLLALRRYFEVAEGVTPDLVARAWIGDGLAGEHAFRGRSTDTAAIEVPMPWLVSHGDAPLVVARQGSGRLYYRLGLSYAPADLHLDPAERGMTVTRSYTAVDDPADVRQDADGTWHVKAGARVRVTLRMVAPARRYHVALVDPLPAGLEPLNPVLATTETVPPPDDGDASARGWWWGPWYDHENLRDERVEAFSRQVWEGVHTYRYVARATTPGAFVVPPAKAEEMYHPETFGRSGTDRVVVEE